MVRTGPSDTVLRLQRQVGNVATRSLLTAQRQATGTATPSSVAAVNADAANTSQRITTILQDMLRSTNPTVRNTAQLYTGSSPRLTWTPMTVRSDSAAMASALGGAGVNEYFFTGVTQPPWTPGSPMPAGTEVFTVGAGGTVRGTVALIRARYPTGEPYPDRQLASTFVHETSHALVRTSGDFPATDISAASFDRYRDEFRAYFIDPFDDRFAGLDPDRRAAAIRTHLVGTSATIPNPSTHGYAQLQAAYWSNPAFRAQVDAHNRPDGFNLTNSPRLDALFTLMNTAVLNPSTVDDVLLAIIRLPAAERVEAANSEAVRIRTLAVGTPGSERIRRALEAPTSVEYTGALNPDNNPRIAGFYDALVHGEAAGIKAAFGALNQAERGRLAMNPAALVFIDRHVESMRVRACVIGMVTTRSLGQFDAVDRFISACLDELADAVLNTAPTAPSARLLAAVRGMAFETRLAFYRLSEDARIHYVEGLPEPVSRPMIAILRGDRNP